MSMSPEELFRQREERIQNALRLRKSDQTPIILVFGSFAARYAGISRRDEGYDLERSYEANFEATIDFQPDMASVPITFGSILKRLNSSAYGLPDDYGYQYAEREYMKAQEYDAFLFDPSDYLIRCHWPRTMAKTAVFGHMPPLRTLISYSFALSTGLAPLATSQGIEVLEALKEAGEESVRVAAALQTFRERLAAAGFPMFYCSGTQAPFDILGSYFRGTKGILTDMYRRPHKLSAACEKLLAIMLETAVPAAKASGNPRVFIPLHKGSDNFMSLEQFRRFYWPTLRQLLTALIEEGLTPVLLAEGPYDSRLKTMKDVPEGKLIYWFENVDMERAAAVLRDRVCIMGNVPMSLLASGTVEQVKQYCRRLLALFPDGGYIMSAAGALDDSRIDNVRALVDFARLGL